MEDFTPSLGLGEGYAAPSDYQITDYQLMKQVCDPASHHHGTRHQNTFPPKHIPITNQAYINEQAAPELLPYRHDLVERMGEHIREQGQRLDTLAEEGSNELARTLLEWQANRAKFLMRRYLRARLFKIQSNAAFVLDSPEYTARLSDKEQRFAKEYFLQTAQFMNDTVLEQLPEAFW